MKKKHLFFALIASAAVLVSCGNKATKEEDQSATQPETVQQDTLPAATEPAPEAKQETVVKNTTSKPTEATKKQEPKSYKDAITEEAPAQVNTSKSSEAVAVKGETKQEVKANDPVANKKAAKKAANN